MATDQLTFAVDDLIDGIEVSPDHVPLSLLGDFQEEVSNFLRGTKREVDTSKLIVAIKTGSLAMRTPSLPQASSLWADIHLLESGMLLDRIDPVRARVLTKWQSNARKHTDRRYKLFIGGTERSLIIDAETVLISDESFWAETEKYFVGKVMDIGGKTKPNLHLELENGQSIVISATQEQLASSSENSLYRSVIVHILAEENIMTGNLRNLRLQNFDSFNPRFDEAEFDNVVRKGTQAWKSISDHNAWLDQIRGYDA